MSYLLLIRHGQTDAVDRYLAGRMPGVRLNELGRNQAGQLAKYLEKAPLKAIYASPLERTIETALPLAQAVRLPVQVRPDLLEIDFGKWQGQTLETLRQNPLWNTVQQKPSAMCFPDGESFVDAKERIHRELETIAAAHADNHLVACFTHADIIRLAVADFLQMPLDEFQRLSASPAAITLLNVNQSHSYLVYFNCPAQAWQNFQA